MVENSKKFSSPHSATPLQILFKLILCIKPSNLLFSNEEEAFDMGKNQMPLPIFKNVIVGLYAANGCGKGCHRGV